MLRFEAAPAALNFTLEAAQSRFILRLQQMAGLAHRLQPGGYFNPFVLIFRVVSDTYNSLLNFI
ncbi:hypothetical protein D3C78_1949990 [compost metagenome]